MKIHWNGIKFSHCELQQMLSNKQVNVLALSIWSIYFVALIVKCALLLNVENITWDLRWDMTSCRILCILLVFYQQIKNEKKRKSPKTQQLCACDGDDDEERGDEMRQIKYSLVECGWANAWFTRSRCIDIINIVNIHTYLLVLLKW